MSFSERADQLVRHLSSLEPLAAGEQAAARELAALEPIEAAHALRVLVERAKSSPQAGQVLSMVSRALMFSTVLELPYVLRGRIYDAAVEFGIVEVAALFVSGEAAQRVDPNAIPEADPTLAPLTLGHKKALARRADPDRMARLAVEGDARVVRELLLNPRMTEGTVIRIAARRPARKETLLEVWKSPKWSVRASVRKSLAMNPYTPPDVSLKILPHLLKADLKAIAGDRALDATVRELARKLLGKSRP